MLEAVRQPGQPRGVRKRGHDAALRRVWPLLDPSSEGETTALQPVVHLWDRERTVNRVQQRVGERVWMSEVLALPDKRRERVVPGKPLDSCGEINEIGIERPHAKNATVLLQHVDAGPTVGGVDH